MPLDRFLPYLMNRIVNRLNQDLSLDLKSTDVTLQFYRVLAVLAAKGSSTVNQLVVYTVIEQSTLSRILVRMEQKGLITRQTDQLDTRVVSVVMTEKGKRDYEKILPIALKHYHRATSNLDDTDLENLLTSLNKILDTVRHSPFP